MSQSFNLKTKTTMDTLQPSLNTVQSPAVLRQGGKQGLVAARSSATRDNTMSTSEGSPPLELGSRWCPEEIEIFFTCKFNFLLASNSKNDKGFQKFGCEWDLILRQLHDDEFSHRTVANIVAFYEQVSFKSFNYIFLLQFLNLTKTYFTYFETNSTNLTLIPFWIIF